jgi:hypothetical protein
MKHIENMEELSPLEWKVKFLFPPSPLIHTFVINYNSKTITWIERSVVFITYHIEYNGKVWTYMDKNDKKRYQYAPWFQDILNNALEVVAIRKVTE